MRDYLDVSVDYDAKHVFDDVSGGVSAPSPDYVDTVGGTTTTAGSLTIGATVTGTIDTLGDRDWYAVSLVAGQTYTFRTASTNTSDTDTYIRIHDASGAVLAQNDDGGPSTFSVINYTATTTGTYYFDVGAYDDDGTGNFRAGFSTVATAGTDSVGATVATAGTLGVGTGTGIVGGAIDAIGDHDWYRIDLVAGQTYLFNANAVGTSAIDTIMTLRNASGVQVATNDDGGDSELVTDSALRYTATTTGSYYVDISAYSTTTAPATGTGAFNVIAGVVPTPTVYTTDQIAGQLTNGYWGGLSHHFAVAPGGTLTVNLTALTAAGQTLARGALQLWTDVTGINFTEVATGGSITFDDDESGAFATAVYAGGITTSANVNISTEWLDRYGTGLNTYSFQTYIHEIGHTLGLGHAGNYNGNAEYGTDSLYLNDSWATTVMSYFGEAENSYFANMGFTQQFTVSPMTADGVAVSNLYGVNVSTRTGDTTYGFNNNSGRAIYDSAANPNVSYTVFDNGGIDTLDYSGFSAAQRINLNAEQFSNVGGRVGNVMIARGTVIENAIGGSGADTLIGNDVANNLRGNDGDDTFIGGLGADTIFGGAGIDTLSYQDNQGAVSINLTLGAGYGNAAQGDVFTQIENVIGSVFNDTIIGDNGVNRLDGAGGNDVLIGSLGADVLVGGDGSDFASYEDNQGGVIVSLLSNQGYWNAAQGDTFIGIENLRGTIYADTLIGSNGANILEGGNGNDILIGGLGADQLVGGLGSDTASYEDNQGAVSANLTTGLGSGNAAQGDTYSSIENLTGTAYNDTFVGDANANRLDGARGADTLTGAGGADTFVFDTLLEPGLADTITDFTHGTDRIELSAAVYAGLGLGTLSAANFTTGAATTADHHILYNAVTGALSYDADGSGSGAAIVFAVLQDHPTTITSTDFLIVP